MATQVQHSGSVVDITAAVRDNDHFRQVLATAGHTQLVVMSVPPGGEIGEEVHDGIDQILVFVSGRGRAVLDGQETPVGPGQVAVVPSGVRHNFLTEGDEPMKLFTVYGPPDHAPGTVHETKEEADADEHDEPPAVS